MKKTFLLILAVALCLGAAACGETTEEQPEETQSPASEPTLSEAVALVYADPKFDMSITVASGDWIYTKMLYEGEVYFYPADKNPLVCPTGFAISSQPKWGAPLSAVWEAVIPNLNASIENFEWQQEETLSVGTYSAERYHFFGTGIAGDYIIWETEELLFICSLTAEIPDYQSSFDMLAQSLKSFQVLSEMEK